MEEVTTSQAARIYDTHPNVLNRLLLMGRLSARKNENGHWLISKASLESWNAKRVRRAVPVAPIENASAVPLTVGV